MVHTPVFLARALSGGALVLAVARADAASPRASGAALWT